MRSAFIHLTDDGKCFKGLKCLFFKISITVPLSLLFVIHVLYIIAYKHKLYFLVFNKYGLIMVIL